MEKTAQRKSGKRSILNKLREMTNVSGKAAEKFFNPEFEKVMNSLRESDNKIRAIVSGQEIEGEDPGADSVSLKDLYKDAKSNINRREYMTAIAALGRFHKKLHEISDIVNNLNNDVDQVHHDFLFKDLDDEQKKHLSDLKSRLATIKFKNNLRKEAGIMDFLVNVGTERGKALSAWEKRYPKQVGKLKKEAVNLLGKTESTLSSIILILKEMASFRATRKVDEYVKSADRIKSIYSNYDKYFRDFYNNNVKNFLEKQELLAPTKTVEQNKLPQQNIPVAPINVPNVPDLEVHDSAPISNSQIGKADTVQLPSIHPSEAPSFDIDDIHSPALENLEKLLKTPKTPTNIGPTTPPPPISTDNSEPESIPTAEDVEKSAHNKFYEMLTKMSNESPIVLAGFIKKYAMSIKDEDLDTSIKLLNIVKSIKV